MFEYSNTIEMVLFQIFDSDMFKGIMGTKKIKGKRINESKKKAEGTKNHRKVLSPNGISN